MSTMIVSRKLLSIALSALVNETPILVHLYTNTLTPDVDTVVSDFTEATYPGYPAGGISVVMAPTGNSGNEVAITTVGVNFPPPTSGGPYTIIGFWVDGLAAFYGVQTCVLSAEFPSPISLSTTSSGLPLVIDLSSLDLNNP